LITANHAVEYGRSVLAVPGPLTNPYSEGTKKLLNLGAELVTSSDDVLQILKSSAHTTLFEKSVAKKDEQTNVSNEERRVIDCLQSNGGASLDLMLKDIHIEYSVLLSLLTDLEIRGVIRRSGGVYQLQPV